MSWSAVEIEQITDCLESEVEKVIAKIMQGITQMTEHKRYRLGFFLDAWDRNKSSIKP